MKLIKLFLFTLLLTPFMGFSQDSASLWKRGGVLIGVNSDLDSRSIFDLVLTPQIGYAVSGNEVVYLAGRYIDSDEPFLYFLAGYNRGIGGTAYIGGNVVCNKTDTDTFWGASAKIGLFRTIGKYVFVAPEFVVNKGFESSEPFTANLNVTFGLKL